MSETMNRLLQITETVIAKSKEAGADFAQCAASESRKQEFNVQGGQWTLMRTLFDRSLSVIVFTGQKKGSIAINSFDDESIEAAIRDALSSAENSEADEAWEIASEPVEDEFTDGVLTPDTEQLFARTKELVEDIGKKHPKLVIDEMVSWHDFREAVYRNSYGVTHKRTKGYYQIYAGFAGHEGDVTTSASYADVMTTSLNRPFISMGMFDKAMTDIENSLYPETTEGKYEGTVILTPDCAAQMFGIINEAFLSDMPVLDGTSIWKDKLGEKVADERISVSLSPHDPRIVCGERFTGEGYVAKDYDVIRDGKLLNFSLSRYVANKTGNKMADNTSFALVINPGEKSIDEIIASVDKGMIVGRFSGGQPGANGEFSGVAKNGFKIENGKISCALTETMISGNLAEMLLHLRDISRETMDDGSISVPYMAFDKITISGK